MLNQSTPKRYGPKPRPIAERFWEKVDKSGDCWEWQGAKNARGYGLFNIANHSRLAHRVSYEITYGPLPDGRCALHRCDNPGCVRPDHLFDGTRDDNNKDMGQKGRANGGPKTPEGFARGDTHGMRLHPERAPQGIRNGQAKLSDEQVIEIRRIYAEGCISQSALGERFSVGRKAIARIVQDRGWKHLIARS